MFDKESLLCYLAAPAGFVWPADQLAPAILQLYLSELLTPSGSGVRSVTTMPMEATDSCSALIPGITWRAAR